jgi:SEC-C motif-containing protein
LLESVRENHQLTPFCDKWFYAKIKRNIIKPRILPLTMISKNRCFCGSSETFANCCQPYITEQHGPQTFPKTAEQLMRSRFSAYASGNSQYIYDTYAKTSQELQTVKDIKDWANACVWIALQVHNTNPNSHVTTNDSPEHFVEFSAFYINDNRLFELHENSRFVLEAAIEEKDKDQNLHWRYLDGDIIKHSELTEIKRKDLCPCNHYATGWLPKKGKKYKQCCGKMLR